ncbi:TlpA family protein disulfide reductase [Pedobacter sp.]|uniref:TlpA family protein disulfide reductase n=1 Tax=Pedobacter sp. TaxID=1411316 RepID=UPI003C6A3424
MKNKINPFQFIYPMILVIISQIPTHAQNMAMKKGEKLPVNLEAHLLKLAGKSTWPDKRKPIIIDFWATWCSPCVNSLPSMDSLSQQFSSKIELISVSTEKKELVNEVLKHVFPKGYQLKIHSQDSLLKKYFPHSSLPHYVWISPQGIYMGNPAEINAQTLEKISGGSLDSSEYKIKRVKWDFDKPLYASNAVSVGKPDALLYHSMLTKGRPDFPGASIRRDNFTVATNNSILVLYQMALGKFDLQFRDPARVILKGFHTELDSAAIGMKVNESLTELFSKDMFDNLYNYEILIPEKTYSRSQLFEYMHQDLNRYFFSKGISGHLEKRKKKILSLEVLNADRAKNFIVPSDTKSQHYATSNYLKFQGEVMSFVIVQLQQELKYKDLPITNRTGYKGKVTLELNLKSRSIKDLNQQLRNYNLVLKERTIDLEMVVLIKK